MSHNLENRNGQWSFAYAEEHGHAWHKLGNSQRRGASIAEWAAGAGLNYKVTKADAFAQTTQGDLIPSDYRFLVREDIGHVLGVCTDQYQIVQPADILAWFQEYITIDERFELSAAGVLHSGERIWCTARFNGEQTIAGDRHKSFLLMSTSFDAMQATINQASITRTVCDNTLKLSHSDGRAQIKTRHSTRFQGAQVAKELAQIAQSFADFKALGDAMARVIMTSEQTSVFLKTILDIPADAERKDISTRKLNQWQDLKDCYRITQRERNSSQLDAWTALQAVTRYVDHDRAVRNADNETIGRFESGTFGSGDAMKGRAMDQLRALLPA